MPANKRAHQKAQAKVEKAADRVLSEEMPSSALGNGLYWIGVVLGAFVLNLLLLIVVAGV